MERIAVLHVETAIRATLRALVEARGLSAVEASSLAELEDAAREAPIALVMVDVTTLRTAGLDALRESAAGDRSPAPVPVVLLVDRGDPVLGEPVSEGIDELIWQPIDARELGLRIESGLARRRTTELVAVASHELRSPIHAIVAFLELLGRSPLPIAQREMVDGARTASRHLVDLVEDLLEHARLGQGPVELAAAPFSMRAVVCEATSIALDAAKAEHVSISAAFDDGVPDVFRGDGPRVRQILINLMSNALKFAANAPVRVTVRRAGELIEIEVADDGPGVPESARALVFEPFRQADSSIMQRHGGTGLGLAIARSIARCMGGDVLVRSATETDASDGWRGAVFVVTLRLDVLIEGHMPRKAVKAGPLPLALLADGDAIHRAIVAPLLERVGYRVETVGEGVAALMHALEHRPALVVIDRDLPVLDGAQVTARLRAASATMPIVGFAREAGDDARALGIEAGMTALLSKPVAPLMLQRALRHALVDPSRGERQELDPKKEEGSGERPRIDAHGQMHDALRTMLSVVEQHGQALDAALTRRDFESALLVIRLLRGSVLALNARGLELVLRDLEQAARASDAEECRRANDAWRRAVANLRANVDRFLLRDVRAQ